MSTAPDRAPHRCGDQVSTLKRINVLYTGLPGLPGTNTFYGHEDGVSTHDQVAAVLAFYTSLATTLRSGLHIAVDSVVEHVDSTNGQVTGVEDTGAGGTVSCSNSGAELPWGSSILVRWRTGVFNAGRELRGRSFIPGATQDDTSAGFPSTALIAAVQGPADTLVGAANLAVFSRTHFTWASVNLASVWSEYALMRSRRD